MADAPAGSGAGAAPHAPWYGNDAVEAVRALNQRYGSWGVPIKELLDALTPFVEARDSDYVHRRWLEQLGDAQAYRAHVRGTA